MQNSKKYWPKFGIAFVILYICLFLFLLTIKGGHPPAFTLALMPALPFYNFLSLFIHDPSESVTFFLLVVAGIISAIEFFALGALVGWQYGKIKDGNKLVPIPLSTKVVFLILILLVAILVASRMF